MKTVCFILLIVEAALYVAGIITAIVGKLHIGVLGYPDEWERKKCETVYNILAAVAMIVLAVLLVLTVILVIAGVDK